MVEWYSRLLPTNWTCAYMWREFQAVCTTLFGFILVGVTMGYSSVAISDIQSELTTTNHTVVIPAIDANIEELSWFGKF